MYRPTCAHRDLPFGTLLEVKNVANEKTVRCVVNDRGPFSPGRDIDLSYAAAKEIGLVGSGTSTVIVSYIGRDPGYIKEVKYVSSGGPFTIQAGAFRERDNALRLKSALELKYEGVYIIQASVNNTAYYRVRVGKFQRKKDALALAKALAEEGYSPLIMHYDERA
jgi:rare lipoprotein A